MSDDANSEATTAEPREIPERKSFSFASTEDGTRFNTLRFPLIPVDCWRLDAPGFAFDSSVVSPSFKGELTAIDPKVANHTTLAQKVSRHSGCPAVLFGHCDPVGDDDLNKTLGDRRVIAIYALLTRQPDLWAYLYDNPAVGDTWGTRALQAMLSSLVDSSGVRYYVGKIDGDYGSGTTAAVKRFQSDQGKPKPPTGQADAPTRKSLFVAYMDWLCTSSDPATPVLKMAPTDFLGGAGAKAGDLPKMSLQGCSEFNPVIVLSASEMKAGGEKRNTDNAPNRRVVMYWFKKGTTVTQAEWPCPKVKESAAACKKAFWPDGETRRKSGSADRKYSDTRDTMACRFYDRFARRSACEVSSFLRIWLFDYDRKRMKEAPYRLEVGGDTTVGNALSDGSIFVSIPPTVTTCLLEWGRVDGSSKSDPEYRYIRELNVSRSPANPKQRALDNLAYEGDTVDAKQKAFESDYRDADAIDVHRDGKEKDVRS